MGTPTNVRVGPGELYIAPLGSTEPTNLATAWAGAWVKVGYTEEGSTVGFDQTFEDIVVEEEYDALDTLQTARAITIAFNAAEMTATNLQRAFNGGTITTAGGLVTFEPPVAGTITRVMLGWESDDAQERWIFRNCVQTGSPDIARQKAPNYATINMEFRSNIAVDGGRPFKVIMSESFATDSSS